MKQPIIYILLACLCFISCQNKTDKEVENLPSEDEMVSILYEIHTADAFAKNTSLYLDRTNVKNKTKASDLKSDSLYADILDRHQISDSTLAMSLIYYSSKLKTYESIYERVIGRMEDQLRIEQMQDSITMAISRYPLLDNELLQDSILYPLLELKFDTYGDSIAPTPVEDDPKSPINSPKKPDRVAAPLRSADR